MLPYKIINILGENLEDASESSFSADLKLDKTNEAQLELASILPNEYLTELEHRKTNVTVSGGRTLYLDKHLLDYDPWRSSQAITRVKVTGASGRWVTMIDPKDLGKTDNIYHTGTPRRPIGYVFGNQLYILPTTITEVDVYFLRHPPDMLYIMKYDSDTVANKDSGRFQQSQGIREGGDDDDYYNLTSIYKVNDSSEHIISDYNASTPDRQFTVSVAAASNWDDDEDFYFTKLPYGGGIIEGGTSLLNPAVHHIMLKIAESFCWRSTEDGDRASAAYDHAMGMLEKLLGTFKAPEGTGGKVR